MSMDLLAQQVAVLRLQAQSFAAQVAAIEATVEAVRIDPGGGAATTCPHPLESREMTGNFGDDSWRCLLCGATGHGA
jgi:hypothetical protein